MVFQICHCCPRAFPTWSFGCHSAWTKTASAWHWRSGFSPRRSGASRGCRSCRCSWDAGTTTCADSARRPRQPRGLKLLVLLLLVRVGRRRQMMVTTTARSVGLYRSFRTWTISTSAVWSSRPWSWKSCAHRSEYRYHRRSSCCCETVTRQYWQSWLVPTREPLAPTLAGRQSPRRHRRFPTRRRDLDSPNPIRGAFWNAMRH